MAVPVQNSPFSAGSDALAPVYGVVSVESQSIEFEVTSFSPNGAKANPRHSLWETDSPFSLVAAKRLRKNRTL